MNTEIPEIVRKQGRPKDTNFPKFVTCTVTGKQFKLNVTMVKRKLAKSGKTIQDYIDTFVCREGKQILTDKADNTIESIIVNDKLKDAIKYEIDNRTTKNDEDFRKELIKVVWDKVKHQPPEFYQQKFKIEAQRERTRN